MVPSSPLLCRFMLFLVHGTYKIDFTNVGSAVKIKMVLSELEVSV